MTSISYTAPTRQSNYHAPCLDPFPYCFCAVSSPVKALMSISSVLLLGLVLALFHVGDTSSMHLGNLTTERSTSIEISYKQSTWWLP